MGDAGGEAKIQPIFGKSPIVSAFGNMGQGKFPAIAAQLDFFPGCSERGL
jgi:hypothetical protein